MCKEKDMRLPKEKERVNEMDTNILQPVERYCSISESLKQSCAQVRAIRDGKLPKKSWREFKEELKKTKSKDE